MEAHRKKFAGRRNNIKVALPHNAVLGYAEVDGIGASLQRPQSRFFLSQGPRKRIAFRSAEEAQRGVALTKPQQHIALVTKNAKLVDTGHRST